MNIPTKVRINGIDYAVYSEKVIVCDGKELYGQIRYNEAVIGLSMTACASKQMMELTLLHEILHGIHQTSGMELENDEAVVEMFARGIYQVIKDNPELFIEVEQ